MSKDNHYLKNLEAGNQPWNDPRDFTPPDGWKWLLAAGDFLLQWLGKLPNHPPYE